MAGILHHRTHWRSALGGLVVLLVAGLPSFAADQAQSFVEQSVTAQTLVAPQAASVPAPSVLPSQQYSVDLTAELVPVQLQSVDREALAAEDANAPISPMRIGVNFPVGIDSTDGGAALVTIPGVGSIWSLDLFSADAQALELRISQMDLPEGAELWVYAPKTPEDARGPFTRTGPDPEGAFWTGLTFGDEVRIEYFLPEDSGDAGYFMIEEISYYYRGLTLDDDGFNTRDDYSCHADVMCYPALHPLHNSAVHLRFTEGGGVYMCSGTLLSTTAGDFTPYILTAEHCCENDTQATDMRAWWFYQTTSCDGANAGYVDMDTDGDLVFSSTGVDISLMMVNRAIPTGLTWAGWTTDAYTNGTDLFYIGHPAGLRKKCAFGTKITHPWGNPLVYFGVYWSVGTAEGGSSGSGVYVESNQLLIGVVSHGGAVDGCADPDGPHGMGKFRYAYNTYPAFSSLVAAGTDDALEDNDTCAQAVTISTNYWPNLVVKSVDEDWHKATLANGDGFAAQLTHIDSWGDIDIELYDSCGGSIVASSVGDDDTEVIGYTNNSGSSQTVYLRVYMGDGDDDTRNEYSLDVAVGEFQIPDAPTNLDASDGLCDPGLIQFVELTWDAVSGANQYKLYRGTSDFASATLLDVLATNSYRDEAVGEEVTWTYWVTALNAGGESDPSTPDTGYADCLGTCFGDLNSSGAVDLADLQKLLSSYGTLSGMSYYDGDMNGDGKIDLADLQQLLAVYGANC